MMLVPHESTIRGAETARGAQGAGKVVGMVREGVAFAVTAGVLFVVLFAGMNLSAYTKLAGFLLESEGGAEVAAPTEATAEEERAPTEKEVLLAALPKETRAVPALRLAVAPPDERIEIARLGIRAPVKQAAVELSLAGDWKAIEDSIEDSLREGAVHFPGSGEIGGVGNAFVTGHSSYYPWDSGRYKEVFALLPKIQVGDEVVVWSRGKKFVYRIDSTDVIVPNKTDILEATTEKRLTLMTCYPLGTALKRFIAVGHLVEEGQGQVVAMR